MVLGVKVGFGGREGALASALIYPITLNGYIYGPGKKIEKIKKKSKKLKKIKKLKIFETISGALARSLIPHSNFAKVTFFDSRLLRKQNC